VSEPRQGWAIALHGGATEISDEEAPAYRRGCERAARAGIEILEAGGSAVDAVVAAVRVLEADATFNAGVTRVRDENGRVRCDAAVMDGTTLDVGAVAGVEAVRHPVDVAFSLLRDEPTLIVGEAAERLAAERGLDGPPLGDLAPANGGPGDAHSTGRAHDTVGCVAVDLAGHVACAVSTGGLPGMPAGRVGDSALPGCGFAADDEVGAVVLSGTGERIARMTLGAWALERTRDTDPVIVAGAAVERLERIGGDVGILVLDRAGSIGWAHSSPRFAVAWARSGTEVSSFVHAAQPGGSRAGEGEAA